MAHSNLSSPSQLLIRNKDYFKQGKWGLINPADAYIFECLDNINIVGLHQNFSEYDACIKYAKHKQLFAAAFALNDREEPFDGIVIYLPKSKQQLSMLVDNASSLVKANGIIMIVGENKAGIKSVNKVLEKHGEIVNKLDSAKHCGLVAVTVTRPITTFDLSSYGVQKHYCINDVSVEVFSLPGVFGHKQLDPGTDLLLNQLAHIELKRGNAHIYDFACGTGVIGCYLAKMAKKNEPKPAVRKISMSDNSALAVFCSKQTAKLNGFDISVIAADGFAALTEKVDLIVSNPPFHKGIKNDYSITEKFIIQAFKHSNQSANIMLVANKFLPYPEMLTKVYGTCNIQAATNQYKVYQARKKT